MINRIFSNLPNWTDSNDKGSSGGFFRTLIKNIDEIPSIFEDNINEIILNEELYKVSSFIGGQFIIEYVDSKSYTLYFQLFFQDKKGSTYETATKKKPMDMARLSDLAQKDLESHKTIKFDIPELSEVVRKKYKIVKS